MTGRFVPTLNKPHGMYWRQIDIFQKDLKFINETKIGEQGVNSHTEQESERDGLLSGAPENYCSFRFSSNPTQCQPFAPGSIRGDDWWFGYDSKRRRGNCQHNDPTTSGKGMCPTAGLRHLLQSGAHQKNIILVWYYKYKPGTQPPAPWSNNFDYLKSIAELYKRWRDLIRDKLEDNKCPEEALESGVLPILKDHGHGCPS